MLIGSLKIQDVTKDYIYGSTGSTVSNTEGGATSETAGTPIAPEEETTGTTGKIDPIDSRRLKVVSDVLVPGYIEDLWVQMKALHDGDETDPTAKSAIATFLKAMKDAVKSSQSEEIPAALDVSRLETSLDANRATDRIFKAILPIVGWIKSASPPGSPAGSPAGNMTIALRGLIKNWNFQTTIVFPGSKQALRTDINKDDKSINVLTGVGMQARVEEGQMTYSIVRNMDVLERYETYEAARTALIQKASEELQEVPKYQYRIASFGDTYVEVISPIEKRTSEADEAYMQRAIRNYLDTWKSHYLEDSILVCEVIREMQMISGGGDPAFEEEAVKRMTPPPKEEPPTNPALARARNANRGRSANRARTAVYPIVDPT